MQLIDLPTDVLTSIFPYLNACEFLSLTSSTKSFLSFRKDPTFWRTLTHSTFRIPPQPLLHADGARWQWLYKRLLTQTRVYTWGNNSDGKLGHSFEALNGQNEGRQLPRVANDVVSWPTEMWHTEDVGVVADIQCGGWCTTLLNSVGQIYAVGSLQGHGRWGGVTGLSALTFPSGWPATTKERYEPATAIRKYSVGRSHILGLSDTGKVWLWHDRRSPGIFIKSTHVDSVENVPESSEGRVSRVVAGWDKSSMYINGVGIVYFQYSSPRRANTDTDGVLLSTNTVPGTSYRRSHGGREGSHDPNHETGEVKNHIVLENYIVFITDTNKIFAYKTSWSEHDPPPDLVELTSFYSSDDTGFQIHDIQGSFRTFAIFTSGGGVLIGDRGLLDAFQNANPNVPSPLPPLTIIPALQDSSTISVAFGDYHFHALHANGTISAHGREPKGQGAFGLGSRNMAALRGVRYVPLWAQGHEGDGQIENDRPLFWKDGKTEVWFEPEKRNWLSSMVGKMFQPESKARGDMISRGQMEANKIMTEWIEREGRAWSRGPTTLDYDAGDQTVTGNEEELPAYFALKVSAAGWHSAALVLVDDEKAERVRQKFIVKPKQTPSLPASDSAMQSTQNGSQCEPAAIEKDVPATWVRVSNALSSVGTYYWSLGRWFLGLTERDEREAAQARARAEARVSTMAAIGAQERLAGRDQHDSSKEGGYIWTDMPFPRLRLLDGVAMPGEVDMTEWRGEEPWKMGRFR